MKQPKWINRLLYAFLESIQWTSVKSPLKQLFTYRWQRIGNFWEITVSPWMYEIYGGKNDGALELPTYEMNLMTIADEFDVVTYMGFDTEDCKAIVEGEIDHCTACIAFRKPAPQNKTRKRLNTYTGEVTKICDKT